MTDMIVTTNTLDEIIYFLGRGDYSVSDLQQKTGRSATWVRDMLKKVPGLKMTTDKPVRYSLPPVDQAEPMTVAMDMGLTPSEARDLIDNEPTQAELNDLAADEAHEQADTSTETLTTDGEVPEGHVPAGPEGSFLGACLTRPDGTTYNRFTGQEVPTAGEAQKKKRTPLNPQHKIREKVEAVEAAGGTLTFDRNTCKWVLSFGSDPIEFTAQGFAAQDATTILGFKS